MDGVDVLAEILITATIDQDSNKPKKGCSIWFFVFLIALALWIGYEFLINK